MKRSSKVEIDERRLTREELGEYARRGRDLVPEVKERWAAQIRRTHGVLAGCLVASLLVAVIGYALDAQVVLAVGGLLATGVGISWWLVVDGVDEIQTGRVPRILARQAAEYLVEIEYADRPEGVPSSI